MASATRKVKVRRRIRIAKQGKKRKNYAKVHGSTAPNLPLVKPNANESQQQQARQPQ